MAIKINEAGTIKTTSGDAAVTKTIALTTLNCRHTSSGTIGTRSTTYTFSNFIPLFVLFFHWYSTGSTTIPIPYFYSCNVNQTLNGGSGTTSPTVTSFTTSSISYSINNSTAGGYSAYCYPIAFGYPS